jgi:hypothetical protein
MTTNFRRITISLPPAVDETVREFAELQGIPQSKVVTDLLVEYEPTLRSLIKVHRHIKAGQTKDAKRILQHTFGDMMAGLMHEHLSKVAKK